MFVRMCVTMCPMLFSQILHHSDGDRFGGHVLLASAAFGGSSIVIKNNKIIKKLKSDCNYSLSHSGSEFCGDEF